MSEPFKPLAAHRDQAVARNTRGWVLAGGASFRMGKEKSGLAFGEQSLLQIAIAKARSICGDVAILCGAQPQRGNGLAPAILDVRPLCGPLGGIEAALLHTDADWNLFLAVDTPLIPVSLLSSWKEYVSRQDKVGVACMVDDRRVHALPMLLRRETLPLLSAALDAGRYRLQEEVEAAVRTLGMGISHVDVDSLPLSGISKVQRAARAVWFANANTPDEMERMRHFAHMLRAAE